MSTSSIASSKQTNPKQWVGFDYDVNITIIEEHYPPGADAHHPALNEAYLRASRRQLSEVLLSKNRSLPFTSALPHILNREPVSSKRSFNGCQCPKVARLLLGTGSVKKGRYNHRKG